MSVESMTELLTAESGVVKLLTPEEYVPSRQLSLGNMTAWEAASEWHTT